MILKRPTIQPEVLHQQMKPALSIVISIICAGGILALPSRTDAACKYRYSWVESGGGITNKTVCINNPGGGREITISTPIGNGKGRFAGGPGNAYGTIKVMNLKRFFLMGGRPRMTTFHCRGERYTKQYHYRGLCGEITGMYYYQ